MSLELLSNLIKHFEDDHELQASFLLHAGDHGPRTDDKPDETEDVFRARLTCYVGTAIKQLDQLLKRDVVMAADRALIAAARSHHDGSITPGKVTASLALSMAKSQAEVSNPNANRQRDHTAATVICSRTSWTCRLR